MTRRAATMTAASSAEGAEGPIDLTPREFELLASLMKSAGKVVSREDLLREAWDGKVSATWRNAAQTARCPATPNGEDPACMFVKQICVTYELACI